MWIVKLGGSFANSEPLILWLKALAKTNAIIVPGGGPFADTVRSMQSRWNFSDSTAHDMALLAMRQYGLMLAELGELDTFESPDQLNPKKPMIWLPNVESLKSSNIEESWNVTSDSLAAWLAHQIGAAHVLLVKSLELDSSQTGAQLTQQGVIDPAFNAYSQNGLFQSWVCGPSGYRCLPEALRDPQVYFYSIKHE